MSEKTKIFYHPLLMPDYASMMLLGVRLTGKSAKISDYELHRAYLVDKLYYLILAAIADGEDVPQLIENYIGRPLHTPFTPDSIKDVCYELLESPQMGSLLNTARQTWHEFNNEIVNATTATNELNSEDASSTISKEGIQQANDVLEETTLRSFLEQLSMIE